MFRLTSEVATAMRTLAEQEERRIYTHYEGWMPKDQKDWPTHVWRERWCSGLLGGLLRDTKPQASPAFTLPLAPSADTAPEPAWSPDPETQERLRRGGRRTS